MATLSPPVAPATQRARRTEYDQYIDQQIRKTKSAVKLVDLASRLMIGLVGLLAVLLTAAVLEHWLIPGGLGIVWRSLFFAALLLGAGWYAWRQIVPLLRHRISPVYAARTIESHSPALKNSLLNLLLFRQHREVVPDVVYRTVEEQAATRLATADVDSAVDRSGLIHIGYLLLGIVAIAGLYKVLSPKDPIATAGRVLMPWADIPVPTRVSIEDIRPGALRVARGETVEVSATIAGLREGETVSIRYSTEDGQAVELPVGMSRREGEYRFRGLLPAEPPAGAPPGVQQPMTYFITAGDARSKMFSIEVIDAPTIVIERVEYDYPEYTGLADRTQPGEGSLRAIEGTRVEVHAQTNHPLGEAGIDLGADGTTDVRMAVDEDDPRRASGEFLLQLDPEKRTPPHDLYTLRFRDKTGQRNREPVHYRIEVIPDLQPEVEILRPEALEAEIRLGESIEIEVEARDPDYALARVTLVGRTDEGLVFEQPLLEGEHRGRFTRQHRFQPTAPQYAVGDVIEYWAEVEDVRTPEPNRAATQHRRLKVIEPPPVKDHPALENQGQGGPQPPNQQGQPQQRQGEPQNNRGDQQQEQGRAGQPQQQQGDGEAGGGAQQQQQPNAAAGEGQSDGQSEDQPQQQPGAAGGEGAAQEQPGGEAEDQPAAQGGEAGGQQRGGPDAGDAGANPEGGQAPQQGTRPAVGGQQRPEGAQDPAQQEEAGPQQDAPAGEEQPGGGADQPVESGETAPGQPPRQDGMAQPEGAPQQDGAASSREEGGSGAGSEGQTPQEPIPSDGSDDATAIRRMLDHLQKNASEPKADQSPEQPQGQPPQQDDGPGQRQDQQSPSSPAGTEQQGGRSETEQQARPQSPAGQAPRGQENSAAQKQLAEGDGEAGTQGTDPPREPAERQEPTGSEASRPNTSQGPAGAGNQKQHGGGAPDPLQEPKPREKTQQEGSPDNPQENPEPPAPSRGEHESDSKGDQGGDREGGGTDGGGQQANREGTGSSGQNQSADEGEGSSGEKGSGDTSSSPGGAEQAPEQTGQPGSEKGPGSGRREGQGNEAGGQPRQDGEASGSEASQQGTSERAGNEQNADGEQRPGAQPQEDAPRPRDGSQSDQRGQSGGGNPSGGGQGNPSNATPPRKPRGDSPAIGDEGNLEYARKQTDLVLDRLENQLKEREVDQDMLDKLGWSEDDLKKFVERWRNLKQAAHRQGDGSAAERELDRALGSLGLNRRAVRREAGTVPADEVKDLRDGQRSNTPVEFLEEMRAYTRGISK